MKLNKIMIAAVAFGFTGMVNAAAPADAGHGEVKFTGSIIEAPCSINPESQKQEIDLGQITVDDLKDSGKSVPRNFYIQLEHCTAGTINGVTTTFTGANSAGNSDLLGITGTGAGASIAITDGSGTVITLGEATAKQTFQDGSNTLAYSAYLQGDAGVVATPGEFSSIVNYSLAYQ